MNHIIRNKYYTVDAKCSAGKTHSAIRHAVKLANKKEKVIIAQPSIKCISEWHPKTQEIAEYIPVTRFDGDSNGVGQVIRPGFGGSPDSHIHFIVINQLNELGCGSKVCKWRTS